MSVSGPSQTQSIVYTQLAQDEIYVDGQAEPAEETADLYIDTGTPILPEDISTFYSLNFPNLSAVSATDCNIQSFTTISSGIAPEAELAELATVTQDKGVNTSTRDLVLAAISVMKGRKARPDTKRICNWVNRKYGRSVQEVVQQIDDLCHQAILEKVDYKGSISFRITSEKKLHKRVGRRKNTAGTPGGSAEQGSGAAETRPTAPKPPRASSPRKSPKGGARTKEGGPGGPGLGGVTAGAGAGQKMDPVTLNLILREELKVGADDVVTKENIINAVEMTKRPINKRAVYRDLETILAHEIHLGYLVKHEEGNSYLMASINKHKHYRGTIPLKSSKRKPKPTQKILEMEASSGIHKIKQEKYSEYVTFDCDGNLVNTGDSNQDNPADQPDNKSDEELKHELMKEELINSSLMKMKSKPKTGKGKHKKDGAGPGAVPAPGPVLTRGTSVQGPILSVPTPYSSFPGGVVGACSSHDQVTTPTSLNNVFSSSFPVQPYTTGAGAAVSSTGLMTGVSAFPPGLTSQPLPYSSLSGGQLTQTPPPAHMKEWFINDSPTLPHTLHHPPHVHHPQHSISSLHPSQHIPPAHSSSNICTPNVEILPVTGAGLPGVPVAGLPGGGQTAPITAHKTRMPLDELSMTTVHHPLHQELEKKTSSIVPIKPRVKKEAWQVSITVKEGKPKLGNAIAVKSKSPHNSMESGHLTIPQVTTTSTAPSSYSTSNNFPQQQPINHFPRGSTVIDTSLEEPTDLTRKPWVGTNPELATTGSSTSDVQVGNIKQEFPIIARKTKAHELSAIDYSSKSRKDPGDEIIIKQEKENGATDGITEQSNNRSGRLLRIERKRSFEAKEDLKKDGETRASVTRNGKKQRLEAEENIKDESNESETDYTQVKKRVTNSKLVVPNEEEPDDGKKSANKKLDVKQDKEKRTSKQTLESQFKKKPEAVVNVEAPLIRSKRLMRQSCSPEPTITEDDLEEELSAINDEPEIPQPETRTSSGRRKRARKIFDPADHDVPSRIIKKCRTVSPVQMRSGSQMLSGIRSSGGHSDDMPETNGLKELIQPVEENSDEEEFDESPGPSPPPPTTRQSPKTQSPLPNGSSTSQGGGGRSTRRGGAVINPLSDILPTKPGKESADSWLPATVTKGKKSGSSSTQNQHNDTANTQASSINGSRRRSRDQSRSTPPSLQEPRGNEVDKGHKTDCDNEVKSITARNHNQIKRAKDSNDAKSNKKESIVKTIAKESSEFKVPRPVTKMSPTSSKSKKIKGKALNSAVKHTKGKSPKSVTGKSSKSSSTSTTLSSTQLDTHSTEGARAKAGALCIKCELGHKKGEKLIFCKDCNKTIHPKCLNYPEDLTDRIYIQPWQCIDCKYCTVCVQPGNDDKLLFCDSCDCAYHMICHRPPIHTTPRGRWECDTCAADTGFKGEEEDQLAPVGANTFFQELLPALPPGVSPWPHLGALAHRFSPASPDLPKNWEDLPVDVSIPDISGWSPARMSQYLVQNGVKETVAKVFFDQELDGASVLVLTRKDVLHSLGIKLGPALKVYQHIKRLQTRRNFSVY